MENKKIKLVIGSNFSKLVTGFGKNMKNVLMGFYNDPDFEIIEAANGVPYGKDPLTPWKSYGTAPSTQELVDAIGNDSVKQRAAAYGFYEIDKIIEAEKPDVYLGIEDIWAFNGFADTKPWWNTTHKIIWTTIDSLPIISEAKKMSQQCDKLLTWASFAEEEMKKEGLTNIETLHGAIDLKDFYPLSKIKKAELRKKHNLENSFVIGFVFKNQLRKSVPNLLEGFRLFKKQYPESNAKLLLHTDWSDNVNGWDIPRFLEEKNIDPRDVLSCYICESCGEFEVRPFDGNDKNCPFCHTEKSLKTKTSVHGLCEQQLNEIYNLMDVYCHPFTSGGQEIPIQEAKAVGLITLVTSYSCGLDSCFEDQGGIPLDWEEYREPHSQFIKASTTPKSINEGIRRVFLMSEGEKYQILQNGKKNIEQKFNVDVVISRLKEIIKEVVKQPIVQVEQNIPKQPSRIPFESFLDKEKKDRILVVMPDNKEDVFGMTSILPSLKKTYPDKDIYFATKKEHSEILLGNPHIHKILDFHPLMENLLAMEGKGMAEGYFEICYLPHVGVQKHVDYLHNGSDKIKLPLF